VCACERGVWSVCACEWVVCVCVCVGAGFVQCGVRVVTFELKVSVLVALNATG